jgi:hypothetical protein
MPGPSGVRNSRNVAFALEVPCKTIEDALGCGSHLLHRNDMTTSFFDRARASAELTKPRITHFEAWAAASLEVVPAGRESGAALHASYVAWMRANQPGAACYSVRALAHQLSAEGIRRTVENGARLWCGLRINDGARGVLGDVSGASASELTMHYRRHVGAWLSDACKIDAEACAAAGDLLASFRAWAADRGYHDAATRGHVSFGQALALKLPEAGKVRHIVAGGRQATVYVGVCLSDPHRLPEAAPKPKFSARPPIPSVTVVEDDDGDI